MFIIIGGWCSVLGAALLGVLTGCVERPRHQTYYTPSPTVYVEAGGQDDHVYYPGYQVYYSNNRHQYIYRDGRSWVSRPAPPRVSADVLFTSPSVRLDFHDSPSIHHASVVKQYPKNGNHRAKRRKTAAMAEMTKAMAKATVTKTRSKRPIEAEHRQVARMRITL